MQRPGSILIGYIFPVCAVIGQALVNDIHTIQPSLNGINEVGVSLKKEAEPPFAIHIQKELNELNAQWENICKQVPTHTHTNTHTLSLVHADTELGCVCVCPRPMLRSLR